jgi:hypothetical protein
MSEITNFNVIGSAETYQPNTYLTNYKTTNTNDKTTNTNYQPTVSVQLAQLFASALAIADVIRTDVWDLVSVPDTEITINNPTIQRMESTLCQRSAHLQTASPEIRRIGGQLARAEQVTIRMNRLKIGHNLPNIARVTMSIQTASTFSDGALARGDTPTAERFAKEAMLYAEALERQVQHAIRERTQAIRQTCDAIARSAGLFTALMGDAIFSDWIANHQSQEASAIAALIREAQEAYIAEDFTRATDCAETITKRTTTLLEATEAGVAHQQVEYNAQVAVETLAQMNFATKVSKQPEGTLKVIALDGNTIVLDIVFQPNGETTIDTHTHSILKGGSCSVIVGKFLTAYRKRVRLSDIKRRIIGTDDDSSKGLRRTKQGSPQHLALQEPATQIKQASTTQSGSTPPAVLAAWSQLKH